MSSSPLTVEATSCSRVMFPFCTPRGPSHAEIIIIQNISVFVFLIGYIHITIEEEFQLHNTLIRV